MTDLASREVHVVTVYKQGPPGPGGEPWDGLEVLPLGRVGVKAGVGIDVDAGGVHLAEDGVTGRELAAAAVGVEHLDPEPLREWLEDRVAALLGEGANIDLTYTDNAGGAGTLTIAVTGLDTGDLSDFAAAATAVARAAIGVSDTGTLNMSYNGATGVLSADVLNSPALGGMALADVLDRDNHTGEQLASTIDDFDVAALDAVGLALADSATVEFAYDALGGTIAATVVDSPTVGGFTATFLRSRANHTGTQVAATISDFSAAVVAHNLSEFAPAEANLDLGGFRVTNAADPASDDDLATRGYVDRARGVVKVTVAMASNVNVNSPGATLDGIALTGGAGVLLTAQTDPTQNGPWTWVGPFVPMVRHPQADTSAEVTNGLEVRVAVGTYAGTRWVLTTPDPIALGATPLTWTQDSGISQLVAGPGIAKAGNTISIVEGAGIQVDADGITIGAGEVTGGGATGVGGMLAPATVHRNNVAAETLTDTEVADANKDGLAGVPSLRTLGPGAQQAASGADLATKAGKAADETITGNWTHTGTTDFDGPARFETSPWTDPSHPDIGMVGDGATDNAPLVANLASAKDVRLPPGTFRFGSCILGGEYTVQAKDTPTTIYNAATTSSTSTWTTPNITTKAGELTILRVTAARAGGSGEPTITLDTAGRTWVPLTSKAVDSTRDTLWYCQTATDVTGAVTFDWAGVNQTSRRFTCTSIPDVPIGNNGADAIGNVLTQINGAGTKTWLPLQPSAFGSSTYLAVAINLGNADVTPNAFFTQIDDGGIGSGTTLRQFVGWSPNPVPPKATWASSLVSIAIAVEVKGVLTPVAGGRQRRLSIPPGAMIQPAAGQVVQIGYELDDPGPRQIFDLSLGGKVQFTYRGPTKHKVRPEWWGDPGDGATTTANATVRAMMDSWFYAGRWMETVYEADRTYLLDVTGDDETNPITLLAGHKGGRIDITGSHLLAKGNNRPTYRVIRGRGASNFEIRGVGGHIQGDLLTHTPTGLDPFGGDDQFGHGIELNNCSNYRLRDFRVTHAWGDGIMITNDGGTYATNSRDGWVENVVCEDNRRENFGVFSADYVWFFACKALNAGVTAVALGHDTGPKSGWDIEPNAGERVSHVYLIDCEASGNGGRGVQANAGLTVGSLSPLRQFHTTNLTTTGNGWGGGSNDDGMSINNCDGFSVTNHHSEGNRQNGLEIIGRSRGTVNGGRWRLNGLSGLRVVDLAVGYEVVLSGVLESALNGARGYDLGPAIGGGRVTGGTLTGEGNATTGGLEAVRITGDVQVGRLRQRKVSIAPYEFAQGQADGTATFRSTEPVFQAADVGKTVVANGVTTTVNAYTDERTVTLNATVPAGSGLYFTVARVPAPTYMLSGTAGSTATVDLYDCPDIGATGRINNPGNVIRIVRDLLLQPPGTLAGSTVSTSAASYAVADTDLTVLVDSTGGNRTVTLPAVASYPNRLLIVKKLVAANTVTIDPNGAETINGAATYALTGNGEAVLIQSDGTTWRLLGRYSASGQAAHDLQVFTATGPWTKPTTFTPLSVIVDAIAGGGGGESGAKGATGAAVRGGAGGGGGGHSRAVLSAADLGATVGVTVGAAGAGGASVTVDSTAPNPGTTGGSSYFGDTSNAALVSATGGGGGGASGVGVAGTAGAGTFAGGAGVTGANGAAGSAAVAAHAPGGGGGGGITAANAATAGGNGRPPATRALATIPAGGAATGANGGSAAAAGPASATPGASGGGGGASTTGNGGNGGAGYKGGGGGGGGGAHNAVGNSGAGGAGGAGIVVVVTTGTP